MKRIVIAIITLALLFEGGTALADTAPTKVADDGLLDPEINPKRTGKKTARRVKVQKTIAMGTHVAVVIPDGSAIEADGTVTHRNKTYCVKGFECKGKKPKFQIKRWAQKALKYAYRDGEFNPDAIQNLKEAKRLVRDGEASLLR